MKKKSVSMTTAQFARLHGVNKRTLHYYDEIGLFSPDHKGENGYRYYDLSQSVDFEYIRMLKELHLSIPEIETFIRQPSAQTFLQLAETKELELDQEIQKLQQTKQILTAKKEQIQFCQHLKTPHIQIETLPERTLLVLPYNFASDDISQIFSYVKNNWSMEQIRMGIGGIYTLDKVKRADFDSYENLYTPALSPTPDKAAQHVRPQGPYLCGYQQGVGRQLTDIYQQMLSYADDHGLTLTGYAYEYGLNEFVIFKPEEYLNKILIPIDPEHSV